MKALLRPAAVVTVCALAAPAWAQSKFPIAVNQRVRVWTAAPAAITGRVVSVSSDGFEVADEGRDPVRVAAPAVQRIESSRARTSKGAGAKKGALRGAIILAAISAVSAVFQREQVGEDGATVAEAAALGVWSGGLFGGLIGAGVGAARAGDKWEQVWP